MSKNTGLKTLDEIDLSAILSVLWSKKLILILSCFFSIALGFLLAFGMQPVYKIILPTEPNQTIDKAQNIKSIIDNQTLNESLQNHIKSKMTGNVSLQPLSTIKVHTNGQSNLLFFSLEASDVVFGKKILNELINLINTLYSEKLEHVKMKLNHEIVQSQGELKNIELDRKILLKKTQLLNNDIELIKVKKFYLNTRVQNFDLDEQRVINEKNKIQNEIDKLINSVKLVTLEKNKIDVQENSNRVEVNTLKRKEKITQKAINRLQNNIGLVEQNTMALSKNKNKLFNNTHSNYKEQALALLMYTNNRQQNLSLLDDMNERLDKLLSQQENTKSEALKIQLHKKLLADNKNTKDIEALSIQSNINALKSDISNKNIALNRIKLKQQDTLSEIKSMNIEIKNKLIDKAELNLRLQKFDSAKENIASELKQLTYNYDHLIPLKKISPAYASFKPIKPRKTLIIILALLLGLLGSVAYVLLRHYFSSIFNRTNT